LLTGGPSISAMALFLGASWADCDRYRRSALRAVARNRHANA
jgi:hypothetical protein